MRIQNKVTGKFLTRKGSWMLWTNEGSIFNHKEIKEQLEYFNNNSKVLKVVQ